jgi:hypothetical protein
MIYIYEVSGIDKLLASRYEKQFSSVQKAFDYVRNNCDDEWRFPDIAVQEVRYASEKNFEKHFSLDCSYIWGRYMNYESDMASIASTIEKYGSWQEAQKAIRKKLQVER